MFFLSKVLMRPISSYCTMSSFCAIAMVHVRNCASIFMYAVTMNCRMAIRQWPKRLDYLLPSLPKCCSTATSLSAASFYHSMKLLSTQYSIGSTMKACIGHTPLNALKTKSLVQRFHQLDSFFISFHFFLSCLEK